MSAKVFLSKFDICPYPEIYFEDQLVGTERSQFFTIYNKGFFEFVYTISFIETDKEDLAIQKNKSKLRSKSKESKKSNYSSGSKNTNKTQSSKKSKRSKQSTTKKKVVNLKYGVFSITPFTGLVAPNHEALIEIKSQPNQVKMYEENIIIYISQPSPNDKNGKTLRLQVNACEPKVNFKDFRYIFKEQYIVEKIEDFFLSLNVCDYFVHLLQWYLILNILD